MLVSSVEVDKNIKKTIIQGKIPHSTSQPVLREQEGKMYLSAFLFLFDKEDLQRSEVNRPTLWCIADVETGEVIEVYTTTEKEFSVASYDMKYSIKQEGQHDVSREYYEKAFAILDEVREEYLLTGNIDKGKYGIYLEMILKNIPKEHHRFFRELSI